MHPFYIAKRFVVFLIIVWLAGTLNFFLPKLSGQDPVRTKLLEQAALGGYVQGGIEDMVKQYQAKFGLDKPLWRQYLTYLEQVSHGDLNYSIANYPRTVVGMIGEALPWTICLLGLTTLFSFAAGTILGALLAWPGAPRWLTWLMPPLWALHAIPFFLLGLVLMWLFAFQFQWLPIFGGYSAGANPAWTFTFITRCAAPRRVASLVHRARLHRRLGAGDARHDGHHDGRGLRDLRRGQRLAQGARSSPATACATPFCRRPPDWRWRWATSSLVPCWLRRSSAIPASAPCCSRPSKRTISS